MKKLVAFLCAVGMLLLFAACAAGEGGKEIPGALPEILDRLYDTAEVDDATRDFLKTGLVTMDMPPEVLRDTLGLADMPDAEAVASEPTAEDDSFFVCLMRMPGGTDVAAFKQTLREAALPQAKSGESVCVESAGDLVLLVMAQEAEKYGAAFHALAE